MPTSSKFSVSGDWVEIAADSPPVYIRLRRDDPVEIVITTGVPSADNIGVVLDKTNPWINITSLDDGDTVFARALKYPTEISVIK